MASFFSASGLAAVREEERAATKSRLWIERSGEGGDDLRADFGVAGCGVDGQREDLEASAVEGDEVLSDEAVSGFEVGLEIDADDGADPIVAVEANPLAIAGEDEKEIEGLLGGFERSEEAVSEKAMVDEGEGLAPDAAHAMGNDGRAQVRVVRRRAHDLAPGSVVLVARRRLPWASR